MDYKNAIAACRLLLKDEVQHVSRVLMKVQRIVDDVDERRAKMFLEDASTLVDNVVFAIQEYEETVK